jgi:hypothetical protein
MTKRQLVWQLLCPLADVARPWNYLPHQLHTFFHSL